MKKIIKVAGIILAVKLCLMFVLVYYGDTMNFFNRKRISLSGSEMKIMTYNIRCMTPVDKGERRWANRAPLICEILEEEQPLIVGFQETKVPQYRYLRNFLEGYESVNTYRDHSPFTESNPLFFRKDVFNLIDKGTFWLTSTPDVMSKEWNSNCYRICTFAVLEEKSTLNRFVVMNTHLDHISEEARINGIKVIFERASKYNLPIILMGDFNAYRREETIVSANALFEEVGKDFDDYTKGTFNNYTIYSKERCQRIDYIFETKDSFDIIDYRVIDKTFDKVFPSDHFPIVIKINLKNQ